MNLSAPFIHRPIASGLLALAILLLGFLAWRLLPVAPLPQIDFPTIVVRASLPGASPESMAATVATPLERSLSSISGVDSLISSSNQGSTQVIIQFNPKRNIHDAARDVQAAINRALNELPAGMPSSPSFVKVNPSQAPIMALALSSSELLPSALYDAASTVLAQKLSQIPGVGEVSITGSSLPAVRVQLNPGALAHQGIALDDVRTAIAAGNAPRPLGTLENEQQRWQIGLNESLHDAADFERLVIRYVDGSPVRLGDVAQVFDSVENRYTSGFHNDRTAVIMLINRQTGANIIQTIDAIKAELPTLRALMPVNSELQVVMDRSPGIRATLKEAQWTLLIAGLLVVAVVWLFLGNARAAAIPSAVIPVSIIGTFAVMYTFGFSLNNLSVLALIVATGLVVDDAIVVLENVQRHIQRGLSPMQAALQGTKEVGFTLLAMNISLVVVFISILFMGGLVERLFREFTITLAATIILSLLVSLTLTPSLCAHWLTDKTATEHNRFAKLHAYFASWRNAYDKSLRWACRFGILVLLALGATLAASTWLYNQLPKAMLPQQDTGQIRGFVRGDDGFSFQVMQPKLQVFREYVLSDPAIKDVTGTSGNMGLTNAMFTIQLKSLRERGGLSTEEVVNRLRRDAPAVPGAVFNFSIDQDLHLRSPFNQSTYAVTLMSGDLNQLREWAMKVSDALQDEDVFSFVQASGGEDAQQVVIQFDRDMARQLGIDMQMATSVLGNSFSQRQVTTLYDRMNQYRVVMELEPQYTEQPEVLAQLQVITRDGERVPLSTFATWDYGLSNDRIFHDNQFAAINIGYDLAEGVHLQQAGQVIERILSDLMLPIDIMAVYGENTRGQNQNALSASPWLILGVVIAVYLVLGMLYESLLHPVTIISTLPSAGIGALLALYLTDTQFTLIALLGLFLLIGIVMKNAILMVDFALEGQREGLSAADAIHRAAMLRLRPILMTNLAGLLGALPLVLGMGEGSELRQPLGIAIIGGLAVSQVLTLYTTPVIFLYFDRLRQAVMKRFA